MAFYAFIPTLDAITGDITLANANHKAGAPLGQRVLRVLRTPLGSYLPDKSYGLDYSIAQKATIGVQAAWRAEVFRALNWLVKDGALTELDVKVYPPKGRRLEYEVSFRDPRDEPTEPAQRLRLAV
jgi:phage gp46-like protein